MRILQLLMILVSWVPLLHPCAGLRAQHAYIPIPEKNVFLRGMPGYSSLEVCNSSAMVFRGDTMLNGKKWIGIRDTNCWGAISPIHAVWRQDTPTRRVWGMPGLYNHIHDEYLLMDFSLSAGDTFTSFCDAGGPVTLRVKAIDSVLLNDGKWHLRQKLYAHNAGLFNHIYGVVVDQSGQAQEDTFTYVVEGVGMTGYGRYMVHYSTMNLDKRTYPYCMMVAGAYHFAFADMLGGSGQGNCDFEQEVWDSYVSIAPMIYPEKALQAQPNPTAGETLLHWNLNGDRATTLTVFDPTGKVILTLTPEEISNATRINLSDYAQGIYLVQLKTVAGFTLSTRISHLN